MLSLSFQFRGSHEATRPSKALLLNTPTGEVIFFVLSLLPAWGEMKTLRTKDINPRRHGE